MNFNNRTSDELIIQRIKKGDHSAMKAIYDRHINYLMGVSTRYVPDPDDSKDILQESFIKIFQNINHFTYRGEGSFRAWITKIVINEALTFIRKASHTYPLDDEMDITDGDISEPDIQEIPIEVIHQFISDLPEGYRIVFNLYAIEEKSHKEIAQILGIKENSSASQYHRAKKLLAKWINEYKANIEVK